MTNYSDTDALLVAPLYEPPEWEPIIKTVIPGGAQLCHINSKNSRTATYKVEVVRYECDPWDEVPTVVDSATLQLEAEIDLLSSEAQMATWVGIALPGWIYLSSYNACPLQVAPDFGSEPF